MKNQSKDKNTISSELVKSTIVLTMFSLIGKILGAIFKIPLTNIIGAEGIGYYQMVFPVFVLLFTISSSGISTMVTIKVAENENNAKYYCIKGIIYGLVVSITSTVVLCLFSKVIAGIQGNKLAAEVYYYVALAVVGVSILNILKAVLRGINQFVAYAVIETIEQLTKVVLSLILASIFIKTSTIKGIDGVFVGIFISTIFALLLCIIMLIRYFKINKLQNGINVDNKEFYSLSIFSTLGFLVLPIIQFIDSILIVNLLNNSGLSTGTSTALFGLSRGTVGALINLPTIAIVSLEFVLLPMLIKNSKEKFNNHKEAQSSMYLVSLICWPFVFLYLFFAPEIMDILYGNSLSKSQIQTAIDLLKLGSLQIFFAGIVQVGIVLLQGKKRVICSTIILCVAGIIKIILILILVPRLGILGTQMADVVFYITATILTLVMLIIKKINFQNFTFIFPFILSVFIVSILKLFYENLYTFLNPIVCFSICAIIGVAAYCIGLFVIKKLCENRHKSE